MLSTATRRTPTCPPRRQPPARRTRRRFVIGGSTGPTRVRRGGPSLLSVPYVAGGALCRSLASTAPRGRFQQLLGSVFVLVCRYLARFALPAKIQLAGWAATGSLAGAAIESPCGLWDTLGGLYTARRALAHVAPYPARLPPDPCLPSAVLLAPRRGHIVVYGESPRRPMCGIDALKLTSVAPGATRRRRCPPRLYTRALHPCRPLAGQGVRAVITN